MATSFQVARLTRLRLAHQRLQIAVLVQGLGGPTRQIPSSAFRQ